MIMPAQAAKRDALQRVLRKLAERAELFADVIFDGEAVLIAPHANWETLQEGTHIVLTEDTISNVLDLWLSQTLEHYGFDSPEQSDDTNQNLRALAAEDWSQFSPEDEQILDLLLAWAAD